MLTLFLQAPTSSPRNLNAVDREHALGRYGNVLKSIGRTDHAVRIPDEAIRLQTEVPSVFSN